MEKAKIMAMLTLVNEIEIKPGIKNTKRMAMLMQALEDAAKEAEEAEEAETGVKEA